MKQGNNARTLDEIADDLHRLDRSNVFDRGVFLSKQKPNAHMGSGSIGLTLKDGRRTRLKNA